MNIPDLTASIAKLPESTRHIIAGSMAFRLSNIERGDLGPMWEMARDHITHHPWPSTDTIRAAYISCGVDEELYGKLVARYDDYLDEPTKHAARRNGRKIDGTADAYSRITDEEKSLRATYEFCAPPEML